MEIEKIPNAILWGGPAASYSDDQRLRYVADGETRIKVLLGNHYDHYEKSAEMFEYRQHPLQVFRWTQVTFVAE